ncbi:hypothetical protein CRG98_012601 [Punica granatum]|uniref:Retrotransposon Copia-like N-terminal domain-containing protein n=1 Tax=Punica granatum TaxID=22663 RepID=A0A2I0KFU7_PUNGR|nr:hypothetical protein CRG98_012601 [Punica granatum]
MPRDNKITPSKSGETTIPGGLNKKKRKVTCFAESNTIDDYRTKEEGSTSNNRKRKCLCSMASKDYTGASLINYKLNGSNYLTWSRAMLTALTAKNKIGVIDGMVPRPPEGVPNRARWDVCNALVISWIFNTLESELQSSVACATVAQELWEDLRERYSQGNETRIYQLKTEISNLKQEGMFVTKYYSRLKTLWHELDNYLEIPACTCSATRLYAAQRAREKTHQFLMVLGSEFGTVRSNILSHEPAHPLNKAYALILHEERQNIVTQSHENAALDGAVFLSKKRAKQGSGSRQAYGEQGGRCGSEATSKTCFHCGRDRTMRKTIGVGELQGGVYHQGGVAIREQVNRVISDETDDLWYM